jgi:hypothetical protein
MWVARSSRFKGATHNFTPACLSLAFPRLASLGRTGGMAAGGDVRRRPSAKFMSEYVKTMRERVKSGKDNVEE